MDYSDLQTNPILFFPPTSQLQAQYHQKVISLKKKMQDKSIAPTEDELVEYILFKKRLSDLKKEVETGIIKLPQAMENLKVICHLFLKVFKG